MTAETVCKYYIQVSNIIKIEYLWRIPSTCIWICIAVPYKQEGEYCGISVNNCESGFSCVEPEYDNDVGICVKNGKI